MPVGATQRTAHQKPVSQGDEPPKPAKQQKTSRETFEDLAAFHHDRASPRLGAFARARIAADVVGAGPETHVERVLRRVRSGEQPLRLVFCNHYGTPSDNTFGPNAARMASSLDAIRPESGGGLGLGVSTVPNKNIAAPVREASERMGRKVDEIHVFGHVGHGIERSRAWATQIRPYVRPDVKIVLHGCYQANNAEHLRATLLAELPDARLYGHWTGSESGMPYQFARVDRQGVHRLGDVTPEVLPDRYRDGWLDAQAANGPEKLRDLLHSPGVDDELEAEIEVRLEAMVREAGDEG